MNSYLVRVLEKNIICENTLSVTLEKPSDFHFVAGQYIVITLPQEPSVMAHSFSLASGPQDLSLEIAMRVSQSPFKKAIQSAKIGSNIRIRGPFGVFAIHKNSARPTVFLAGGIGITPLRSIIRDEAKRNFPAPITLIYANKKLEACAYYDEFINIKNKNFSLISIFEEPQKNWSGEKGFITAEIIKKYFPDATKPNFYIVGPTVMVNIVKKIVLGMGVDKNNLFIEAFGGYH